MLRMSLLIASTVVVALAIEAAIFVPPRLAHESAIRTKAIGAWRETDLRTTYKLEIRRGPGDQYGADYAVTYPRSFAAWFPAALDGDEIHIRGENTKDVVWTVTYDEKNDSLTLTRPIGGETHTLKRISD